jgi:hypothetical protein
MAEIKMAKQAAAKELGKYVERVAEALGKKDALVTDESTVKDFLDWSESPHRSRKGSTGTWVNMPGDPEVKKRNDEKLARATHALGVPVERADTVVAVARKLRDFMKGGKS